MKFKNAVAATRRLRFWSAARLLTKKSTSAPWGAGALTALAALAGTALLADRAQGATFTYTPTNNGNGPDNWSTSPNFGPTPPVSGTATALTFVGSNTTQLASGLTSTSTNNLGDFVLNSLSLQGTDAATGTAAATININSAAGSFLDFQANGTTTPVVNLNALANAAGLIYNVNSNATLRSNLTFQGGGTATFNFNGIVSGAGSLNMAATGTLTLGGLNTYTGGTTVSAGTLNLGTTTALGTGPLTMAGGTVAPTATATSTNLATTGTAINFTSGAYAFGTPAISANLNLTGATGGSIVKTAAAGNPSISGNLNLGGAARTFALADTGGDGAPELAVTGNISNGSVVMDNTFNGTSAEEYGSLFFSGANTYAGGTAINVGRLEIGTAGSLGTGNVTVGTRGTLAFGGSGQTYLSGGTAFTNNISLGHTVNGNYGQDAVQMNSGEADLTGTVTLTAASQIGGGGGILVVNANNLAADVITGNFALTKAGGSTLVLLGAQAYTGGTTVTGGVLQLGNGTTGLNGTFGLGTLANGSVSGTINQTGGGILIDNLTAQTFSNTVTGTGNLQIQGNAPVTLAGNQALGSLLLNTATVTLSTNSVVTGTRFASLGVDANELATLTMPGSASLAVTSDFNVGDNAGSDGILNLGTAAGDNPTLNVATLFVGKGNNSGGTNVTTGVVNQVAGTVNQTAGGESRIGGGTGAGDAGSVGIYRFSGGTINMANSLQVGAFGQGQFLQTGAGTTYTNSGGYFDVGRYATGFGVVDVSAGAFNQTGNGFRVIVGEQGTGIMTLRGTGTANFAGGLSLGFDGGTGIFNLNTGGTLTTQFVSPVGGAPAANTVAGSRSTFNFNGGTLRNSAATTNFFNFVTTANVFGGGAVFDTGAGNATVGQSLVAPAGGGISSVAITSGGSSYVAPPIVQITGGSGRGATGIATINANGQVTGVVITNPGTGYVAGDNVTFNFAAAGFDATGSVGSGATATATITPNTSGGLTKIGANALTLTGTNTYTGATTVSAGTLVSGSAGAIPANTALVNNATVNFNAQYGRATGSTTPGLTLSNLTAGANSQFSFGLSNTTADYLAVTGAASVAAGAKLTLNVAAGTTALTPGTYNLFTDAAGGLANFTLGTTTLTVGGQAYAFTLAASNTSDILTISAAQTAKLYYTGNTTNNLGTNGNYSTDAAGATASTITPSGITDLVFSATNGRAANFNTTLGGLTAANSLEFTGTGTTAGTTPVIIGGPGTLTLNAGANSFAAGTGIVIDAGAAADTISANLSLPTSETFINNSASRFTISGAIGSTNTGTVLTLNDAGGGGFLLSGANTYTGSTVVTAGTTSLGSATALGNAGNTVSLTGGTLDLNGQTVTQSSLTLAGGVLADSAATPGSLVLSAAGTTGAAINVTATYAATAAAKTGNVSLTGATNFIAKSVNTGNVIMGGGFNLNAGATTIALADTGGDAAPELGITGVVSGTGSLTLNNQATSPGVTLANNADFGTLLLSGNNTYSGGTNLTHGRIVVTGNNALGTGPVTISQIAAGGGGTLQFGDGNYNAGSSPLAVGALATGVTLPNAINLGGAINGNYGAGLINDNGANTLTGAVTLTNANQNIAANGGTLTLSGVVGQSVGVTATLTKSGGGTLALTNAANTYTGVTNVTGGTLSVSTLANGGLASSIGASSNAAVNLVLTGNGVLAYTGAGATTDRAVTIGAGGGGIDNANALTIGGQVVQANGSNGSFTKSNAGTLSFTNVTGTNTFTAGGAGNNLGFVANGGVTVFGGTATAPLAQTNQFNSQFIVGSINSGTSPNAEVDINGGTTTITDYIGVGRGNGTNNAATTLTLNNNAVVTSPNFSIGYDNGVAGFTSSPTVNFNGASRYTDGGVFTVGESANGAGGVSTVNVNGTAAVVLTSTGAMPIIGLNGAGVFNQNGGTVTTSNSIRLAANGSSTGTYNLNGGTLSTASVQQGNGAGNFVFNGGTLQASASDSPNAANPTTFILGVTTTVGNGGAIINTNGFNVTVASALTRAGGSTGGLAKNGTGILTLSVANTYVGTTAINAGTLTISTNGGLAAGNVTVAAGATLTLATGVTTAHNAATGTTLTLASTTTSLVTLSGTGVQDTVAALIINGVMQPLGTYGAPGSNAMFTNIEDFTGTGQLLVAAVPEPSTWAAVLAGVGMLAYARRRQVRAWLGTPRRC